MFYKLIETELISTIFVQIPDGFLHIDFLDRYELPIHGWYYFETEEEAKTFFNIND